MEHVRLEDLQEWLDEQIAAWRAKMDKATDDYAVDAAGHMIDAYQAVRAKWIGEPLPAFGEE